MKRRAREHGTGLAAVLLFAGAFVGAWFFPSKEAPRSKSAPGRVLPGHAGAVAPARRASLPAPGLTSLGEPPLSDEEAAAPPGSIRKSRLPEWMRFRYEHSTLALSTEMAVRVALDDPVPLRDVLRACMVGAGVDVDHRPSASGFDLSAEIRIEGRDAAVHGWGCDADGDTSVTGPVCDCVIGRIREELEVTVPTTDVPEKELRPYEGMLSLRI